MASTTRRQPFSLTTPSRRAQIVWLSFIGAVTGVTGLLAMLAGERPAPLLAVATSPIDAGTANTDPLRPQTTALDTERWRSIVIHHSGRPTGDERSLHRRHVAYGYDGLGHHFVIGNGHGLGEGVVHVGYRWNQQLPGAHAAGPRANELNEQAVSICLIGNGNQRAYSELQIRQLIRLVQRLQREIGIPATGVHLHSDVAEVADPGRYFPTAEFETQLLD